MTTGAGEGKGQGRGGKEGERGWKATSRPKACLLAPVREPHEKHPRDTRGREGDREVEREGAGEKGERGWKGMQNFGENCITDGFHTELLVATNTLFFGPLCAQGKMLLLDFDEHRIIADEEIKARLIAAEPRGAW